MRRTLVVVLVGVTLLVGCRKKTYEPFYEAKSQYELAVARDGDAAYGEQLDDVVAQLQAVPPDTIEAPLATSLLATIERERKRLAAEEAEAAREQAAADAELNRPSPFQAAVANDPEPSAPSTVDAGPPAPPALNGDLTEGDFLKFYGRCVAAGPTTTPGDKPTTTHTMLATAECARTFGVANEGLTSFVFVGGKLTSRQHMTRTTLPPDAGVAPR